MILESPNLWMSMDHDFLSSVNQWVRFYLTEYVPYRFDYCRLLQDCVPVDPALPPEKVVMDNYREADLVGLMNVEGYCNCLCYCYCYNDCTYCVTEHRLGRGEVPNEIHCHFAGVDAGADVADDQILVHLVAEAVAHHTLLYSHCSWGWSYNNVITRMYN